MNIWFDMDGTIADLYAVDGWLSYIVDHSTRPYEIAKPLVNMDVLACLLNRARVCGHKIGIISWTAKGGTVDYNTRVETAKRDWLARNLPAVEWDMIKIVSYGTDKKVTTGGGILFDDEEQNRVTWGFGAYEPCEIMTVLTHLG